MINIKKPERVLLDIQNMTYKSYVEAQQKRNNTFSSFCRPEDIYEEYEKKNGSGEATQLEYPQNIADTCLYVTDDYERASDARKNGFAVLIYLHEGNKEKDFTGFRYFIEGFEDADYDYFHWVFLREKGLPWIIAKTQHLILREMIPEDTDALYALYKDKSVVEYMEDLPENREEESVYIRDYIDKVYNFFGFGMWLVQLKATGEIIGRVGFQNYEEDLTAELGFLIKPEYQGLGYANEACKAAIEYMRETCPEYRLMARCVKGNERAVALCKKLGISYTIVDGSV